LLADASTVHLTISYRLIMDCSVLLPSSRENVSSLCENFLSTFRHLTDAYPTLHVIPRVPCLSRRHNTDAYPPFHVTPRELASRTEDCPLSRHLPREPVSPFNVMPPQRFRLQRQSTVSFPIYKGLVPIWARQATDVFPLLDVIPRDRLAGARLSAFLTSCNAKVSAFAS